MLLLDRCLTRLIEGTVRKKTRYGTWVRCASKIELKYNTLVQYQGTVRFKNWSEVRSLVPVVRYGSRCELRSTQVLNLPNRTAILEGDMAGVPIFFLKYIENTLACSQFYAQCRPCPIIAKNEAAHSSIENWLQTNRPLRTLAAQY